MDPSEQRLSSVEGIIDAGSCNFLGASGLGRLPYIALVRPFEMVEISNGKQ